MELVFVDEEIIPCSFSKIFLSTDQHRLKRTGKIILHESAHVKNRHFIDLILFGLAG